ncbi:MAG: nucleotidyltransferase family protein [Bacteroidota bacterium]
MNQPKIAMVILAAGESSRMGGEVKQLLPWKKTTLLGHVIEQGLASNVDKIIIVLGANYHLIRDTISNYDVSVVYNPDWKKGMGTSLAFAIRTITENQQEFDAVLVSLADQPLIDKKHFNSLIYNYIDSDKNICTTKINNNLGVPAVLDKCYFGQLIKLAGDTGARKIISQNMKDVLTVENDKSIDIDDMNTYISLYKN